MLFDVCYRKDTGQVIIYKNANSLWSSKEKGEEAANENGLFFSIVQLDLTETQQADIPASDFLGESSLNPSIWKVNSTQNPTQLEVF